MNSVSPIPKNDSDFVNFLSTLDTKLPSYATLLNLTPAELADVHQGFIWMQFAVVQAGLFQEEVTERVSFKKLLRKGPPGTPTQACPGLQTITVPAGTPVAAGVERRLRALLQRVKNHLNFTEAIGHDLGMIPPAANVPENPKPTGRADALPGCAAQVSYAKEGFDGVQVESRRSSETAWTSLGVKLRGTFVDDRPPLVPGQPETRSYRMRFQNGDTPVGQWSDVFSATVAP